MKESFSVSASYICTKEIIEWIRIVRGITWLAIYYSDLFQIIVSLYLQSSNLFILLFAHL